MKFYDRKEIKDIIAYLKLIYNHNDSQALKRIINEPKRGIGDTTINKLNSWADEREISIYEALKHLDNIEDMNAGTKAKLQNFFATIEAITSAQENYTLSEYVTYVLEASGYSPSLRQEDNVENQSRLENLEEFVNVVKEFEDDDFVLDAEDDMGPLGNFLSQVALVSDVDEIKEEESSVTLMTLHAAKGLEYPCVFMAGMEDGIFPHGRSIGFGANKAELEEERRLMYVGITRAKEKLYLTHAKQRKVWGNFQSNPRSRFLDEIPFKLLDEDSIKGIASSGKSSFSSAVSKAKEKKNNTFNKPTISSNSGSSTSNFASSLARIKQSSAKAQSSVTSGNLASSLANIKKITSQTPTQGAIQTNKINYKQTNAFVVKKTEPKEQSPQEKLSIAEMIAKAKQKAGEVKPNLSDRKEGLLPIGTRVFHTQFGVGKIKEIEENNYIVEFSKYGDKTMDSTTSGLKTF